MSKKVKPIDIKDLDLIVKMPSALATNALLRRADSLPDKRKRTDGTRGRRKGRRRMQNNRAREGW